MSPDIRHIFTVIIGKAITFYACVLLLKILKNEKCALIFHSINQIVAKNSIDVRTDIYLNFLLKIDIETIFYVLSIFDILK